MNREPLYRTVTECRFCRSERIDRCIDLGEQHLASAFVPTNKGLPLNELKAPLTAFLCLDCGLLQLGETVRRPALFTDYHYRSGTNPMMRQALQDCADDSAARAQLQPGDAVLDTGCNDGTMLTMFPAACRRFGIEPAANISWDGVPAGITIRRDFFGADLALRLTDGAQYRLVTSVAMLYSVDDVLSFARDVKRILAPDGVWAIQVSYVPSTVHSLSFYDICHEHLYYFTLKTLSAVLERSGLRVIDVSVNEVNGGSIRVHAVHAESAVAEAPAVAALREREQAGAWGDPETYRAFMERVGALRRTIRGYLETAAAAGRPVIGLGASTKGNVLLQYFDIDRGLLPYISERNPDKVGLRTLGTDIELISEERARSLFPVAMLVLIWFFKEEIVRRERPYLEAGGSLLFPMPYPHLVAADGTHPLEWDDVMAAGTASNR